ncbi:MAG: hypothetical protein OXG47_03105 [bacterium]|nr:hypothetical protein [bacterium]
MNNPVPLNSIQRIEELRGQVAALETLVTSILPIITDWHEREFIRGCIAQSELPTAPETVFNQAMQDTLDRLLREMDTT